MLYETATPTHDGFRDLPPSALRSLPEAVRLVDVREPHELVGELGRIDGVESVPLATLARRARAWPRDEAILLICRSGGRSSLAARTLVAAGFQKVMNLAGGMLAYRAAGLPVARR
jgi:rhodanese-related sulfurtransferase